MTPRPYSSMEAFIAHWRALRTARSVRDGAPIDDTPTSEARLSAKESELLRAMERVLGALDPEERAALACEDATATDDRTQVAANARARRRQRALAKLSPVLAAAGWLQ